LSQVLGANLGDVCEGLEDTTLRAILDEIQGHKREIFPGYLNVPVSACRRVLTCLPLIGSAFDRRPELFGGLIDEVERQIDADPKLIGNFQQEATELVESTASPQQRSLAAAKKSVKIVESTASPQQRSLAAAQKSAKNIQAFV
jgi:hypothetical protein